jgi:hypothetical protein
MIRTGNSSFRLRASILTLAAATLGGCDALRLDTYWHSGDYELLAIDVKGQMSLSVDLGNGGAIGIVGPTVFSIGSDKRYVVVKQHPAKDQFGNFDRNVTNYFVVARMSGSALERNKGVRGPLTKSDFDRLSALMTLPVFTKAFRDWRRILASR